MSDTREQILESAREIFASKGFKGATVAEIAKKAGISEGAIYRHFNSKYELLMECVAPVLQHIIDNIESELPRADNLREFIKKNLEMRLKFYNEYYSTFKIVINEMPYSKEVLNQYMRFISEKEQKISELMSYVKDIGDVRRTRNYLLFAMGQLMSLFFYSNLKEWDRSGGLKLTDDLINIEDDHVIDDLTVYIMYGISGVPGEKTKNKDEEKNLPEG